MTEPRDMRPLDRALWLIDELEQEKLVEALRCYHDDLPLDVLRQMAAFWQRVWPLWFERRQAKKGARGA